MRAFAAMACAAAALAALPAVAQGAGTDKAVSFNRPVPTEGKALFEAKCGLCHIGNGPGTISLEERHGRAKALLAERTDLAPDYVSAVVRLGLATMPPFTRVDLTDAQLARVATYLSQPKKRAKK